MSVVVLGSANADLVVEVARRPAAGETVLGSDTRIMPGGKGANTAVAAARAGAEVALVAAVGTDDYGTFLLDALREAGVDTTGVRRVPTPTGLAYITLTPDGENSIIVSPGANSRLTAADVDLGEAAVLVASLEVPIPVVEHAVALAVREGVRPVVNLSPVAELSAATIAALDPLVVNEHEAKVLADYSHGDGPRSTVITLGARGALVITADGSEHIPAPQVEAVDTTGAGDAFTGALAARLADGATLAEATRHAITHAAESVTRHGAQG
ncbi:ribokinase [Actinokineospora sp. HUAS TT18]|uniref:ribokinase n=1 Tax=Actinokineospora sp. HUAS TT18 TaxID=3447451 RepID=UPI003F5201E6